MSAANRILIADDNEANVELLEAFLAGIECEVDVAVNGQDTLDKVSPDNLRAVGKVLESWLEAGAPF